MSNPNTITTPKQSNQGHNVIKVDQLQRNQEDCKQTLEVLLSCVRNPKQHLGQRVVLRKSKHFAKDMQTLEKIGYVRNPEQQCFELPQKPTPCPFKDKDLKSVMRIADDDQDFVSKMEWLENNGYTRNADKNCWESMSSPVVSIAQKKLTMNAAGNLFNLTKATTAVAFVLLGSATGLFIKAL